MYGLLEQLKPVELAHQPDYCREYISNTAKGCYSKRRVADEYSPQKFVNELENEAGEEDDSLTGANEKHIITLGGMSGLNALICVGG
ncbi:hypothetical protein KQX54_005433 [Cotesia glomerata]|uniref:Uncharacterized protein n=1 Tax=Cotesia glomerata TaxID=32391 RepID=A0AAV7I723_COTGL|nr:hypothetical protein KQX54_005433 [Cotesia glomerata]